MRQYVLDAYTAWINWSFDHPWVMVLGGALYIAALVLHRRARKGHW